MSGFRKVFLSYPMHGYTEEEQRQMKQSLIALLKPYDIPIYNNPKDAPEWGGRLWFLGEAIKQLGTCNAILMHPKWKEARGCNVEHEVAKQYDIEIIYAELEEVEE